MCVCVCGWGGGEREKGGGTIVETKIKAVRKKEMGWRANQKPRKKKRNETPKSKNPPANQMR